MPARKLRKLLMSSAFGPAIGSRYAKHRRNALQRALSSRYRSDVVVDAVSHATIGHAASRPLRETIRDRAANGESVDDVVDDLLRTPTGVEQTFARSSRAMRAQLDERWAIDGALPGPLVFLHVMKVGGTSLRHMLAECIPANATVADVFVDDLVVAPRLRLATARLIVGHLPYEAVGLLTAGCTTLTIMRDPVERSLSHYRHLLRVGRLMDALDGELSLERFAFSDEFANLAGNYQARYLAHEIDLAGAWINYSPIERYEAHGGTADEPYPLQSLFDMTPLKLRGDDLYRRAHDRLERIDEVGTTERLEEVGLRVAARLGSVIDQMPWLNRSPAWSRDGISDRIWRRLDSLTQVDRALYDEATARSRELSEISATEWTDCLPRR